MNGAVVPGTSIGFEGNVAVTMRDGCRLRVDISRPLSDAERVPVILERTPYGKRSTGQSEIAPGQAIPRTRDELAVAFVERGYAMVVQDCRGCGDSDGEFTKYVAEAEDGFDTLAWIARQPWCDGRIGTMGFSYGSQAQLAAAALAPRHLAAMFLDCGGFFDAHRSGLRQGGTFDLKQATWAYAHARRIAVLRDDDELLAAIDAEDIAAWLRRSPWDYGRSPIARLPVLEREIVDYWRNEAFGPMWMRPGLFGKGAIDAIAKVPTFLLSGWFDTSILATLDLWEALRQQQGAGAPLVVGPWTHGDRHQRFAGQLAFGSGADLVDSPEVDTLALRLDWFDRVLLGKRAMQAGRAPVRYYLMGGGDSRRDDDGRWRHGGRWIESTHWPPADATDAVLFLAPDGGLFSEPSARGARSMVADPARPVPTIGGAINSGHPVMAGGAYDQVTTPATFAAVAPYGPLAARDDVLVFATDPLTEPVALVGSVAVRLFVVTDGQDADLAVKLIDVYPPAGDGSPAPAFNVADGILRLSHRDPDRAPLATTPGSVYDVVIETFPTANVFAVGHRIRLDIAGSNFPHYDINPNSDPTDRTMAHARRSITTIHTGGATPSHLTMRTLRDLPQPIARRP